MICLLETAVEGPPLLVSPPLASSLLGIIGRDSELREER
jgi:hypothetical protein